MNRTSFVITLCVVLVSVEGKGFSAPASPPHPQLRPSYSYTCADLGGTVIRSNAGGAMQDFILPAASRCLAKGATITIRNADAHAWLPVYGTLVQYPNGIQRGIDAATGAMTFIEGGVVLGGGCPTCISVAFIKPGRQETFVYDGETSVFPSGTVGDCKGCAPNMAIKGATWRLLQSKGTLSLTRTAETMTDYQGFAPLPANWAAHEQTGCCTCVPFSLWDTSWFGCNSGAPWALATVHNGKIGDVMRLELRAGDHWWNDAHRGQWSIERSLASGPSVSNGKTTWEAYAFLWECGAMAGSDGRASGSYWLILEDIHSDPKLANGVVPIQTELLPGGHLAINARAQNGNHQNYVYVSPTPLACGKWHDVVREFDIDPAGGFLREWLDGEEIVNFSGRLGNEGDSPYTEFELYRADYYGVANTYAERIAAFQLGTRSLAARIAKPPVLH